MFYGQYKTDKYISEFFEPGYIGTCIDVGAARPKRNNNTYYFEQAGWTTYCIEPNQNYASALKAERKNVYDFAVGADNQNSVEFTICTLEGGNQEPVTGLKVNKKLLKDHLIYNPKLEKVSVRLRTLDSFIDENNIRDIDFVSIDTEGTELDVLRGFDLHKHKPRLLIIENNYDEPIIETYLKRYGYIKKRRVAVNDFYERSEP